MKTLNAKIIAVAVCSAAIILTQIALTPENQPTGTSAEIQNKNCKNSSYDFFVCDVVHSTCYEHWWSESDCTGDDPTWFWDDICEEYYTAGTCSVKDGVTQMAQTKVYVPYPAPTSNCGCTQIASGQEVVNGVIIGYKVYSCVACVLNTLGRSQPHTVSTCSMIE